MDTEDGHIFIKNLAYFVQTHEKALANALLLRQSSHQGHGSKTSNGAISSTSPYASFTRSYFPFTSRPLKPAKLTLTPHHLFYLLSRFEELGIAVGPMNIRLEDLHTETSPSNYVSFLNNAQRRKIQSSDRDSIHSVSSIRSVMSSMTVLWSSLGLSSKSQTKSDKHKAAEKDELKYLYSAFTKVPCLKLAPDHRAPLIRGYEEFPFDSAVPLFAFKNLTALEICDVDFRQFYGWDRLADQIRSLTVKRAKVDDPTDLLINIVLDDMDKRRKRSSKLPTTPPAPWPTGSPKLKRQESVSSRSAHSSPPRDTRRNSDELIGLGVSVNSRGSPRPRRRSASPSRPSVSRHSGRKSTSRLRRSSGSSGSSAKTSTPRGSSSSLLSQNYLPSSKWRFLYHLSLTDNSLTHLTAVSLAPVANTLQSLDLSYNLFTEIPDCLATLVSLRALNLSHCMIESLHSLVRNPLPAITVLNLRANRLSSMAGIERLLSLERIDIRENKLTDPTETARLTCIPNMVDIYVNKNPFVRNYGNYRITIFNLFRKTPGYTDDIFIDGTQPAYSERKHLVDRALEQARPPIVKLMEDHLPSISSTPAAFEAPSTPPTFAVRDQNQKMMYDRRSSEYGQSTQKKKKGPRRRVVDIAQVETTSSPEHRSDSLRLEPSPLPPPAFEPLQRPVVKKSATMGSPLSQQSTQRSLDMIEPFPPIDTTFSPPILRTGSDPTSLPTLSTEGDTYRKKIEALRNDFGSGWLSALNDDAWDSHQRPAGFDGAFNPLGPLGPPTGSVRTASQGIVSGGRTLG